MNGIVSGKSEKPSGSLTFKKVAEFDLSTLSGYQSATLSLKDNGLAENGYVHIVSVSGRELIANVAMLGHSRDITYLFETNAQSSSYNITRSPRATYPPEEVSISSTTTTVNQFVKVFEIGILE